MNPILVDFLGVDIQHKNIVWQICDTFVQGFILFL
jgi:hypothetical protein